MEPELTIGTFSSGIARRRHLPAAMGARVVLQRKRSDAGNLSGIAGWGLKDNTRTARQYADRHGLPYLTVEDGFIRSIGLGVNGAEPFGFIVDRSGIYYDATRPSDLEELVRNSPSTSGAHRARRFMDRIVREQIYKYNHVWDSIALPQKNRPRILLIDQTRGDLSVKYGLADAGSFRQMLAAARERYPQGAFFIKTHPDVIAGKKKGYLAADQPTDVTLIGADCNPHALIRQVDHVYTVTSQMGFEALLAGKPVSCFGMPFYAGWGLTEDHVRCPRRDVSRSIESLFDAAYLKYVRYVDPVTGRPCELEQMIDRIAGHKRVAIQNTGKIFCFGFRFWKHGIIRRFLDSPRADIRFVRSAAAAEKSGLDDNSRVVVWGLRNNPDVIDLARHHGIQVERVEDGFIRSVGLGSDFVRPSSLIVDRRGIYFDPRTPSVLEELLNSTDIDETARQQARCLRETIVSLGMSKYNAGCQEPLTIQGRGKRPVILVPGQVEDDASIAAGCVDIRTNLDLLRGVRRRMPDAYIIYKPHPDVLAGNRRGALSHQRSLAYCDQIVTDRNISVCLEQADQVHTLTSLAGFEALMRGKTVYTYGRPFYAGWGLTDDRHPIPRRQRRLTLDDLVYFCLILYPRYYDWQACCFVGAADIVDNMRRQLGKRDVTIKPPIHRHLYRKAWHLLQDLREAWHGRK
jgi:capsular polysaccharide export protein